MRFVSGHTLGCVNRNSQIAIQALPLFIGAPIGIGRAHFLFEQAADELGNRGVFVRSFAAGPVGDLGVEGDCDSLGHVVSVPRPLELLVNKKSTCRRPVKRKTSNREDPIMNRVMTLFSEVAGFRSDEQGLPLQGGRTFAAEARASIQAGERVEYVGEAADPSLLVIRYRKRWVAVRREVFADATRD
jgi:hypothetical protein